MGPSRASARSAAPCLMNPYVPTTRKHTWTAALLIWTRVWLMDQLYSPMKENVVRELSLLLSYCSSLIYWSACVLNFGVFVLSKSLCCLWTKESKARSVKYIKKERTIKRKINWFYNTKRCCLFLFSFKGYWSTIQLYNYVTNWTYLNFVKKITFLHPLLSRWRP